MRLPKSYIKTSLIISGVILSALIFGTIFKNVTANTFADNEAGQQTIAENHHVVIYDQGKKLIIKTDAITVGEALDRAGYELASTDIIEPARTTMINYDNFYINIYRSRPVLVTDGKLKIRVETASYDPKTIAEAAGFSVYDGDDIDMIASTDFVETGAATTYKITRNGGQTVTIETTIPYEEETKQDASLADGETKITQEGEEGRRVAKYLVQFVNGEEVSRELVSDEVTKEPVKKITAVGSKKAAASIRPEWETCAGWARQAGVSEGDLETALTLIYHESGCRTNATNASSGAYGIPQALPGNKMATMGDDWETNPITQIRWMINYVTKRYGGWSQAMTWWWEHHWY